MQISSFSGLSWRTQATFRWDDDDVHFVLDQHAYLDFYCASSLKQQSADRHVAPLIFLILTQPVFALTLCCCREVANTNFVISDLTQQGFDLPHSRQAWWPSWISLQNNNLSYICIML